MALHPQNYQDRPSDREICRKVADALSAVEAGRWQIGLTKHLWADLVELGWGEEDDLWALLPDLLREIKVAGPAACYAGGFPPKRSYEPEIENEELWPYHWNSKALKRAMYLKFVLRKNKQGDWMYIHVDLHPDHPK